MNQIPNQDSRYNAMIELFVRIGDLIICNLLFYLFCLLNGITKEESLIQTFILLSIAYFTSTIRGGIILHHRKVKNFQIVLRVLRNVGFFGVITIPLIYLGHFSTPPIGIYCLFLLSLFIVITIFRLSVRSIVKQERLKTKNLRRVILIGGTENNVALYHELSDDPMLGYRVYGYFDDNVRKEYPPQCPRLGSPQDVIDFLKTHREIQEAYCCLPSAKKDIILPIIHYCENNLVRFYSVPNVRNYLHHRMYLNIIGSVPFLSLHEEPLGRIDNRIIKRIFDIVFSLLFLCTFFPFILIIVTIITKVTMPGPVFFKQKRTGLNGKTFTCFKFRSMRVNDDADQLQATKNDPRTTKWGEIMRHTNIDELPQFINVLLGSMSVVGPRPHMLKHTEQYSSIIDKYMIRHFVKPGITGWSQVNGFRGETKELGQMEGRISGDIWYIEHWTFGLDLYIIYKTIANAIHGEENAY